MQYLCCTQKYLSDTIWRWDGTVRISYPIWLEILGFVDWIQLTGLNIRPLPYSFFHAFFLNKLCEHLLNKYPCNREIYSTEIYCKTHLETSSIASLSSSSSLNNLIFASESLILWNKKVNTGKNVIYLNGPKKREIKMFYVWQGFREIWRLLLEPDRPF